MRPWPHVTRAVLALLAATLITNATGWAPARAAAGRDYPRCIRLCGMVGKICDERCDADCHALFSGDQDLISACVTSCKAICTSFDQDCRMVCKVIKDPYGGGHEEP